MSFIKTVINIGLNTSNDYSLPVIKTVNKDEKNVNNIY